MIPSIKQLTVDTPIDVIMAKFEFDKLAQMMKEHNWRWAILHSGARNAVPGVDDLKWVARDLLEHAQQLLDARAFRGNGLTATGGLIAYYDKEYGLALGLEPQAWAQYYIDDHLLVGTHIERGK